MIKTHGLNHISLSVSDPQRSLAFYQRLFGVREYFRDADSIQVLGPGAHDVIAFERRAAHGKPGGIDHFGFRLTDPADIDAAGRRDDPAPGRVQPRLPIRLHRRSRRLHDRDLVRVVSRR
jgi:catechol 2,3-dioxygenase-like lactoylglutathione lyase family enzyme